MGGAAGHLQHLYENRDITFKDLKQILIDAASGRLEETTEKFDGMNLMFTWDCSTDTLKVARADGDIKRGGMSLRELSEKFKDRPNISEAFSTAFKVLKGALSTLHFQHKRQIFGEHRDRWYSAEVIYTKNPNVVNYDRNAVTFHKWPVKSIVNKRVVIIESPQAVDTLVENVAKMQRSVSRSSWTISGPKVLQLQKLSNGTCLNEAIRKIDQAMRRAGVTDSHVLGDYLSSMLQEDAYDLMMSPQVTEMVVSRCMEDEYGPTLTDIKKYIKKTEYVAVRQFVENCPKLFKKYIRPLEAAINGLAVEVLKGLQSSLIHDSQREVDRIKSSLESKIHEVESSGNASAIKLLREHLDKMGSIDEINTPVEGVVFVWKGNAYKFTGNFAAAGQILGIFKYSRSNLSC